MNEMPKLTVSSSPHIRSAQNTASIMRDVVIALVPAMAVAVGQSRAARVLIPVNRCETLVAGVTDDTTASLLQDAMAKITALASSPAT